MHNKGPYSEGPAPSLANICSGTMKATKRSFCPPVSWVEKDFTRDRSACPQNTHTHYTHYTTLYTYYTYTMLYTKHDAQVLHCPRKHTSHPYHIKHTTAMFCTVPATPQGYCHLGGQRASVLHTLLKRTLCNFTSMA